MSDRLPCSRRGVTRDIEIVEREEQVTIRGKEVSFIAHYSRCTTCGNEFETSGQLDADPIIFKAMYAINSGKIGATQRRRIEDSPGYKAAASWDGLGVLSREIKSNPGNPCVGRPGNSSIAALQERTLLYANEKFEQISII